MKSNRFTAEPLQAFLQHHTVATLPQLKTALGTAVDVTVFRKLSTLPYRTSYSHRGAYYTLDPLAHYDELGLWSYRDIHFSRQGTLLDTTAALVTQSPAGYFTDEVEALVHVAAKDALRQLTQRERISRAIWGAAIFIAPSRARGARSSGPLVRPSKVPRMIYRPRWCFSIVCWTNSNADFTPGWRAWSGAMAANQRMAKLFGLDAGTVARGRVELLSGQVLQERVRRAGGGRPRAEKKPLKS